MGLFANDEAAGRLSQFIKIGEVSSVNPAMGTARVVFDDDDSVVSYDLPVIQTNTFANKDYAMPDVGEDVLCLFLPSGPEEGFILGSFYAGEIELPESNVNVRTVVFSDGTRISYDRSLSTLSATIGETSIEANRRIVAVKAPEVIVVEADGIEIKGGTNVSVTGGSSINLVAPTVNLTMGATTMRLNGSQATIEASDLEFKGTVTVTGNLSVAGNVSASGSIDATGTVSGSNIK